jgi:catechol 2,3-dioxygenase-like lactoylglutathione lyase family enzyme
MSTTETTAAPANQAAETRPMDLKLEVAIVPVSDADRAKRFYASLGWREDADFTFSETQRVLQFTPPGSQASIIFGTGVTAAGSVPVGSLLLAVEDIEAARADLRERGVDVSEVFHGNAFTADGQGREPGPDPERQSYSSFATFGDPDGNQWLLQEVTTRLPGRVEAPNIAHLAGLLLETAMHHDAFEKASPEHNWWDWYAPYLNARQQGSTSEEATAAADRYMAEVKHISRA